MDDKTCQLVVRRLIEEYDWVLPREDELMERVLSSIVPDKLPSDLDKLAYSVALYEACWQTDHPERREGAYHELFDFLYRAAYNRWPELAQDATQRALVLVFEQMDRCRGPATFLAFALYKLRQALKEEQRAGERELPVESVWPSGGGEGQTTPRPDPCQEECLRVLMDAITRLPDRRQQQTIVLKFFEGLSDAAIGDRLGITVSNARVLRHRGIQQLRTDESLRDYFQEMN